MSIEVTDFDTEVKIELMVADISNYKYWKSIYTDGGGYSYTWIELRSGKNINAVETVAEIKAKIDAVDYLKKISDSLGDLTFRLECLDNVLRKL